jgi:two-component system, NtrC family, sensor kinase
LPPEARRKIFLNNPFHRVFDGSLKPTKYCLCRFLVGIMNSLLMMRIRDKERGVGYTGSLSFKLYLIIIPTTILAIVLISYIDSRVAANLLDRDIKGKTAAIANQLAADLARLDPSVSPEMMRIWLGQVVETNFYVTRIDVFRLTGNSLTRITTTSSAGPPGISLDEMTAVQKAGPLELTLYQDREPYWKIIVPFSDPSGATAGCVSVVSSMSESELVTRVHDRIDLLLIPISIVVLVLLLHYLYTRVLTGRIRRLEHAMAQARQGDLSMRAPVESQDELSAIARLFNATMTEIQRTSEERNHLLEEQKVFNTDLQSRVKEATRELSSANLQLSRANQDLIDTQRRLTQYERMAIASQMAAAFAHEVGSPLSAITTHLELMLEEPGCGGDARRRIQLIQEQISRITGFVEELLSETRAATQAFSRVQLNDILKQLLLFLGQHLERFQIEIEADFRSDLPEIHANPQQLQQVFLNLLNNAADAMPQGGKVRIATQRELEAPGKDWVVVSVSDTGVGIAGEEQKRIFEPFFSTKDFRRGTGLGLSIAARIVRQHQGEIAVESEPGAGTIFTIRFPALAPSGDAHVEVITP